MKEDPVGSAQDLTVVSNCIRTMTILSRLLQVKCFKTFHKIDISKKCQVCKNVQNSQKVFVVWESI